MSLYQKIAQFGPRFISRARLFKWGFNLSPMYRRSTGRIQSVAPDLMDIRIRIPLSWRNRNYVNTIFGGSMFSAVDPIPMVQLINLLGPDYVVWDKSAQIRFKRPAKETLYARFEFKNQELESLKQQLAQKGELELTKTTYLTNKEESQIYCEVDKVLYVARKEYYKQKQASRRRGSDVEQSAIKSTLNG